MKKKLAALICTMYVAISTAYSAQDDNNLILLDSSLTNGYNPVNTYLIKNSIRVLSQKNISFSVLATGVSADTLSSSSEPIAVPEQDWTEYTMADSRVILTGRFDCDKKLATIERLISFDQQTNLLKEQKQDSSVFPQNDEEYLRIKSELYEYLCKP